MPSPSLRINDHVRQSSLYGISCTSANSCVAVGTALRGGPKTLVETWNGSTWSVASSPDPGPFSDLNGVSCTAADNCTAVGEYESAGNADQTLIESWNGSTWSVVPSPNASGQFIQTLQSVSCVSVSACIATGSYGLPIVEAWDGTDWSMVTTPKLPGRLPDGILSSVSCVSATTCIAAGYRNSGFREQNERTLVEQGAATG